MERSRIKRVERLGACLLYTEGGMVGRCWERRRSKFEIECEDGEAIVRTFKRKIDQESLTDCSHAQEMSKLGYYSDLSR